jgi:hypothetical protein
MQDGSLINQYFKLSENQTSIRQEMLGGLTTFVTMSYIIVVNPQLLAHTGMPAEGVLFATCISAAVATLVMGLVRELSHRSGSGDVAERLLHVLRLPCDACTLANRTRGGFLFRCSLSCAYADACTRADRERHSRLS